MPYEISWEDAGVRYRFWGDVTDQELTDSALTARANPRFDSINYMIGDFSEVTDFPLSSLTVRETATRDRNSSETNPAVRVAIIGGMVLTRGLANLYRLSMEAQGSSWDVQYFEDLLTAEAWARQ